MSFAWRKCTIHLSHDYISHPFVRLLLYSFPSLCLESSYLSHKLQPKPVETPSASAAAAAAADHDTGFERDYTSRVHGAVSGAIFSIGDLFRDIRDGTKAVRFPKDLLKVLEQKLQDIAMGKDPAYVFSFSAPLPSLPHHSPSPFPYAPLRLNAKQEVL